MQKKKRNIISILVAILVICGILAAVARCVYNVKNRISLQTQAQLHSMANQNAAAMEKQVESIHVLLNGVAAEFQKNEDAGIQAKLEFMQPYIDTYQFKRMGFIDADGMAYTTDGYQRVLKETICFDQCMKGESYASDSIIDSLGTEEPINVFSVPVYDHTNTDIVGVLFATYSTSVFNEILIHDIFNSESMTFIMKPDGTIVAGYDITQNMEDVGITQALIGAAPGNKEIIYEIINDMQFGKTDAHKLQYGESYYVYYMPITVNGKYNDWYLFTVVPERLFNAQFNVVWYDVQRMINLILAGVTIVFVVYFVGMYKHNLALEQLAYVDELTGGDNYTCFKEKIAKVNPASGCIITMDIGDFRIINNICGEKTGDQLLVNIWDIISKEVSEVELAAHMNADQFVMYLNTTDEAMIVDRVRNLTDEMHLLVEVLNVPHVMPYFGICVLDGSESLEKAYSRASQAKNSVKSRRDMNYEFYDDKVFQQAIDNKQLEDSFEGAIAREEFEVWYQPKYDTMDGRIVGAEALVRWRKDGELIPPFKFIPLFERNGMIATLDEYVFRNVCRQQKAWMEEGKSLIPVSINISRASLFFSGIANRYEEILKSFDLAPQYVQLEITESATLENDDITSLMNKFHDTGFRLLLDDFGSGYSSLATLNTMNFDILKLDKSLIDYIGNNNGEELLRHTVELAKHLGLNITAEGVETQEQVHFLQEVKCDDIQGYYFSKPLPQAEFERLLKIA